MENSIDTYLQYQTKTRKLASNTILSYQRDLYAFFSFLEARKIKYKKVKKAEIYEYISYLQQNGKSASTVARVVASIRNFYKFLVLTDVIKKDPAVGISSPKGEKKLPGILTVAEVDRLLSQPQGDSFKELRDKAMLEVLYATGVRASVFVELTMLNLDLNNNLLMFMENDKQRVVPFGNQARIALERYLSASDYHSGEEAYLFTNLYGKKLTRQGFWKIIKYYKTKASIKKEVTPQVLRHSFAAHLMDNGIDDESLQELMGYSAISSVKKYAELSNRRIVDIYKKVHPRA